MTRAARRRHQRVWGSVSLGCVIAAFVLLLAGAGFHDMKGHPVHVLVCWAGCAGMFLASCLALVIAADDLT